MPVGTKGWGGVVLSVVSAGLVLSVVSAGLVLSVVSAGLVLSVVSAGLVLSVVSAGLVLSVVSAGLVLSVVSVGFVLSVVSPKAGITCCATKTVLQTEQWLPSVKPLVVAVGSTAGSTTTVWLSFGANSLLHTVQVCAVVQVADAPGL